MAAIRFSDRMRERMTLSFEVFPPKTEAGIKKLPGILDELVSFQPDYISCTYGAGGTNAGKNEEVLRLIRERTVPCTHYTCVGTAKEKVKEQLGRYLEEGVEHILALRGDYPTGWTCTGGDFAHATDLVRFIRETFGDSFEIAVAAAPGGHVDCISEDDDISYLRMKQDLGADYIITQLCYDLEQFKVWRDKLDKAGITMPIDVGIMPVTTKSGVLTQCFSRNACAVPRDLALVLTHHWFDTDPDGNKIPEITAAFRQEGLDYSAQLLNRYLSLGINGIHLYALNRADDVREVLKRSGFHV
jgi:methylenetetrahydrofolate reductase (NADPH)